MVRKIFMYITLLFICCLFAGCSDTHDIQEEDVSSGWKEQKIFLSAEHVAISEEDYKKIDKLKTLLRNVLIDHPDTEVIEALGKDARNKIGDVWLAKKGWEYNLSCVPLVAWNYEKNQIDSIITGLILFDDTRENANLMQLGWEGDKLRFDGFETIGLNLLSDNPQKKYLWTKADYYTGCFIGPDNNAYYDSGRKYPSEEIEVQGDYYGKFDCNQIGISIDELTAPSNCIRMVLSDEAFR